jgi:hypothetical protein
MSLQITESLLLLTEFLVRIGKRLGLPGRTTPEIVSGMVAATDVDKPFAANRQNAQMASAWYPVRKNEHSLETLNRLMIVISCFSGAQRSLCCAEYMPGLSGLLPFKRHGRETTALVICATSGNSLLVSPENAIAMHTINTITISFSFSFSHHQTFLVLHRNEESTRPNKAEYRC